MKRILLISLLAAALLLALTLAIAEGRWVDEDAICHRYHAAQSCALAREVTREADSYAASYWEIYPCPACVPDEAEYSGLEAWERGGTVVVRIPEDYMAEALARESVPAAVPDGLLHDGGTQDADLARLLHGREYLDYLSGATEGAVQSAEALIPEYTGDALLMSCRHLGAAWYLVIRPDAAGRRAMRESGEITLTLRLWRTDIQIQNYAAGSTFEAVGAARADVDVTLKPEKSSGKEVCRWDAIEGDAYGLYVLRDKDVNTLIVREMDNHSEYGLSRRVEYCGDQFALNGYADGKEAVYVCAVTDAEVAALREKLHFDLYAAPLWRTDGGEAATEAQQSEDYAPVSEAVTADGTVAELSAAEYPVGVGFISCALTRPEGGVAYYGNVAELQWMSEGRWHPLAADLRGCVNGDPENTHGGWFSDKATITWPLNRLGALPEGLYRLRVGDIEMNDGTAWLEFRVKDGAADPGLPEAVSHAAPDFELLEHTPSYADAAHYNSCADNTRARLGDGWRLLAGGVVYELRGIDESWGWGIINHYSLFAWPEGQPERAAQLIDDFNQAEVTLYDLGDGLLLMDDAFDLWRCDLDGGNLRGLGGVMESRNPFFTGGEAEQDEYESYRVRSVLPVGDGLYIATEGGIWYTGLDPIAPKRVYRAETEITNYEGGAMVYSEGRLFVDDGGVVALDTRERDADGMMPATRLTDGDADWDGTSGFNYIVLNGRLYCWDAAKKATVSIPVEGGEAEEISKERYWFHTVTPSGIVLALSGTKRGMFGDDRTAASFYFPNDPANPAFDPDHCQTRAIDPDAYDYVLGDCLYHTDADGIETWEPMGRSADNNPLPGD